MRAREEERGRERENRVEVSTAKYMQYTCIYILHMEEIRYSQVEQHEVLVVTHLPLQPAQSCILQTVLIEAHTRLGEDGLVQSIPFLC